MLISANTMSRMNTKQTLLCCLCTVPSCRVLQLLGGCGTTAESVPFESGSTCTWDRQVLYTLWWQRNTAKHSAGFL